MSKYYYAYNIFGFDNFDTEEYVLFEGTKERAYEIAEQEAADEWVNYGGLHGIGYDSDTIDEYIAEGYSKQEINDMEWEEACNSVSISVLTEDEYLNLKAS